MNKKAKDTKVNKPKYPLIMSFIEIVVLFLIVAVVSTYGINNILDVLFTSTISDTVYNILNQIVYPIILFGGSILILIDNFTGKGRLKKIFSAIGKFYSHPKTYWKQHAVILTILIGTIVYSQIYIHNNASKLCGENGSIYYCKSGDEIVCEDNLVPVFDKKTYKCVDYNTYRHDYEHEDYHFICTKQYRYPNNGDETLNNELIEAEKTCLYDEIIKETNEVVNNLKSNLPISYDIRDKVTIKAGNQENANTCSLWSKTKALEISAQLKGIDYKFLKDFESKINDIKIFSPENDEIDADFCFDDECIPGKKKQIYNVEFGITTDNNTSKVKYYPNFTDKFKKYRNEYISLDTENKLYNNPDFILNTTDYLMSVTKNLVMKYGSAFIISSDSNTYVNPSVGHEMIIIGWDDEKNSWLVLNSWGNSWNNSPLKSNGDGTTWIKYFDPNWSIGNGSIELLGK